MPEPAVLNGENTAPGKEGYSGKKEWVKRSFFAGGILLAGILLRVLYLAEYSALPVMEHVAGADVSEYYAEAGRILLGQWAPDAASIHGNLYSYVLAFFLLIARGNLFAVRLIQGICFLAGMIVPLYFLLRRITAGEKSSLRYLPEWSCLITALYPPLVVYGCDFFSENLMIVLLLCSLLALEWRTLYGALSGGITAGLALTAHAGGIFFIPFAALYLWFHQKDLNRKKAWGYCGVFLLGVMLVIAPVSIYKSVKTSSFTLLQKNSMFNAYLGNNPQATGTCYLSPGIRWEAELEKADPVCAQQKISQDTYFRNRILHFVLEQPHVFIAGLFRKGCMALSAREFTTWSDITSLKITFFHAWGYHGWFLVLLLLGGPFLITGSFREDRRKILLPFLVLFAAGFCSQVFFLTSGRYRLILTLPLAVAGGAFLAAWYSDLKSAWSGLPVFGIMFLLFGVSIYPWRVSMLPERDYARSLLADAWLRAGKPAETLALYREGSAGDIFPERRFALLGRAYMALNRISEAQNCFERCAKQFPFRAEHWMNLSALYSQQRDFDRAARCLYRAGKLRLTPALKADLEYNLGEIFQRCRRMDYARKQYEKALKVNPLHRKALNNLGTLYLVQRPPEPEKALSYFRKACASDPENHDFRVNLALAYVYKGDKKTALEELEKILKRSSSHSRALQLKNALANE